MTRVNGIKYKMVFELWPKGTNHRNLIFQKSFSRSQEAPLQYFNRWLDTLLLLNLCSIIISDEPAEPGVLEAASIDQWEGRMAGADQSEAGDGHMVRPWS